MRLSNGIPKFYGNPHKFFPDMSCLLKNQIKHQIVAAQVLKKFYLLIPTMKPRIHT